MCVCVSNKQCTMQMVGNYGMLRAIVIGQRFLLRCLQSPTQDTSKAKLISRMAKMGKPMLPLSGAVPAMPDSDHEDQVPVS